jgi:NAD(P)-dependent dehydrogenase (short-subunit alcohol dehydrogenase family)
LLAGQEGFAGHPLEQHLESDLGHVPIGPCDRGERNFTELTVRGVFNVKRAFLPGMLARNTGNIINIASVGWVGGIWPYDFVSISGTVFTHIRFTAAAPPQPQALANQWPHYFLNRSKFPSMLI